MDTKIDYVAQGKKNRAKGAVFELKVRKKLEEEGWIVSKWQNNVDLDKGTICKAKGNRFQMASLGFPDFIAFRINKNISEHNLKTNVYEIILIECKVGKYLNKNEKTKVEVLKELYGFNVNVAYNDEGTIKYKTV